MSSCGAGAGAGEVRSASFTAPLQVLYEDEFITICIKLPGIFSEEMSDDTSPSMPALLRERWAQPDAFVGVVHRLDVGVGGVMVYARTPAAAAGLARQITAAQQAAIRPEPDAPNLPAPPPTFCKEYRAVFAGGPDEPLPAQGTLRDWLFKDSRKGKVFAVSRPRKGVREALLDYTILQSVPLPGQEGDVCSLASITLHTGRTHQVRVQFASRRHPLWGDGKYGSRQKGAIALQCARLRFLHPVSGQPMDFSIPMPQGKPWDLFL